VIKSVFVVPIAWLENIYFITGFKLVPKRIIYYKYETFYLN